MTSVAESESAAEPCPTLCGLCSSCVFAPEPPGSGLWTVTDELRRTFIVGLILRCTRASVLLTIQEALSFTSWDFFNYGRSESLTCDRSNLSRSRKRASGGKAQGPEVDEIWDWFTGGSDATKSRYLLRLFSFCDSELLRMAANLTNVLLARQQRGLLPIDGKEKDQIVTKKIFSRFHLNLYFRLQLVCFADRWRQSSTVGFVHEFSAKLKTMTALFYSPSLHANGMSFSGSSQITSQHDQGIEADSENPALAVVPGSSQSMSGVSQYRDFISCLPGHLSKRILGKAISGCLCYLLKAVQIHQTCRIVVVHRSAG